MTQPARQTDTHAAVVITDVTGKPVYGPNIVSIINKSNGKEVDRCERKDAPAKQAEWDAKVKKFGV